MTSSMFSPEELVSMKGKSFPVVGGRLRLAHLEGLVGIETEVIHYESRAMATVKARVIMHEGAFTGHGYADAARDGRLSDALLELAETRAIARALRFAGFGVEYTGAEEVSHVKDDAPRPAAKPAPQVTPSDVPSPSQMALLRRLSREVAEKTGEPVEIAPPRTAREAMATIRALEDALASAPGFHTADKEA